MGEVEENEIITLRLFFPGLYYIFFFCQVFILFFLFQNTPTMWSSFAKRCLLGIFFLVSVLFSDFSRALIHAYRHGKTSVEMSRNKKDAPRPMDDSLFRDKAVALSLSQVRQASGKRQMREYRREKKQENACGCCFQIQELPTELTDGCIQDSGWRIVGWRRRRRGW